MHKPAIVTLLFVLSLGCAAKKDLDKVATKLRETVVANDYAAFKTLFAAPDTIAEKFPPGKLKVISDVLKNLGAFRDQSMKSISVKSGQPDQGKYELEFEKGMVHLDLAVEKEKIVSFRFHGDDFQKSVQSMAPPMRTGMFHFLDAPKGKPLPGKSLKPGPVHFVLGVGGIVVKDQKISFRWNVKLLAGDKELDTFEQKVAQPVTGDKKLIDGNLANSFQIKTPGKYMLRFEVFDEMAGRGTKHEEAFEVVAP